MYDFRHQKNLVIPLLALLHSTRVSLLNGRVFFSLKRASKNAILL